MQAGRSGFWWGLVGPRLSGSKGLVSPRLAAPERKIVGIGGLAADRFFRLDHLVGNALALAISHGLFLGIETKRELLLHVGRRGPAHQGLDRPRLLRFIFELPFTDPGLS